MSTKKQIFYDIDPIIEKGCNWNLIFGEKSNGKSYQAKTKNGVLPAIDDTQNSKFFLLRRYHTEITPSKVEQYFADLDFRNLTGGEYNTVVAYRNKIYLARYDMETMKTTKGEIIGYYDSLSREQNNAGGSFLDVKNIIFEEFMSRTVYLPNEPYKLQTLYSTIDRKRATTKVIMVGNSVTRIMPYFKSWDLDKIVRDMKQGDIIVKNVSPEVDYDETDYGNFNLAVEYCRSSGGNKTALGKGASSIDSGKWQSDIQPKLPRSSKEYKVLTRFGFHYSGFKWLADVLIDESHNICWFIYPKKIEEEFTEGTIIFSDIPNPSFYVWANPYSCALKNTRLQNVLDTFVESKIFYSDDLTGTDFKRAINFIIRK